MGNSVFEHDKEVKSFANCAFRLVIGSAGPGGAGSGTEFIAAKHFTDGRDATGLRKRRESFPTREMEGPRASAIKRFEYWPENFPWKLDGHFLSSRLRYM